jgi:hypothetical protein
LIPQKAEKPKLMYSRVAEYQIPFEIVSGISSGIASPLYNYLKSGPFRIMSGGSFYFIE